jgi:superfamily II DNA helicase RecQ
VHYAENETECRLVHIRRYFEDGEPRPCGHCDVCEPKLRRRRRRSKGRGHPGSDHRRSGRPAYGEADDSGDAGE